MPRYSTVRVCLILMFVIVFKMRYQSLLLTMLAKTFYFSTFLVGNLSAQIVARIVARIVQFPKGIRVSQSVAHC